MMEGVVLDHDHAGHAAQPRSLLNILKVAAAYMQSDGRRRSSACTLKRAADGVGARSLCSVGQVGPMAVPQVGLRPKTEHAVGEMRMNESGGAAHARADHQHMLVVLRLCND